MEIAGNLVEIVPDAGGLHRQILNLSQIGNDIIVERNQNTALIIVFLCTVIMIVDGDKAHTMNGKIRSR